jgi:hypothetical protein
MATVQTAKMASRVLTFIIHQARALESDFSLVRGLVICTLNQTPRSSTVYMTAAGSARLAEHSTRRPELYYQVAPSAIYANGLPIPRHSIQDAVHSVCLGHRAAFLLVSRVAETQP